MIRKGNIFFKLLLLLYLGTVAFLCFANFNDLPETEKTLFGIPADKITHFFMFLPFPFIAYFSMGVRKLKTGNFVAVAAAISISGLAIGAATELVQSRLAYRSGDINDFATDAAAVLSGTLIVILTHTIRKK